MADDDLESPLTRHFLDIGKRFSRLMGWGSIDRCNCLIRQSEGADQDPAIRKGKGRDARFYTPEGHEIACVVSFEDMPSDMIMRRMKERSEEYIGHIFGPFSRS